MSPTESDRALFEIRRGPIALGDTLECDAAQTIALVLEGRAIGTLAAGRHVLDPIAIPFLEAAVRQDSDGALSLALDLVRVRTDAVPLRARGSVGDIVDRLTQLRVGVVADIQYSVQVTDPLRLAFGLGPSGDAATAVGWLGDMLLAQARDRMKAHREPIDAGELAFSPLNDEISAAIAGAVASSFAEVGLRLDPPTVALAIRDEDQSRWSAAATPLLEQQAAGIFESAGAHACSSCGAAVAGGKFCAECGNPLPRVCRCGASLGASQKFCSICGAKA